MSYIHHINKELIQLMPLTAFEGEVIVVDREEQVADAIAYLSRQRTIGVDTEARPSFQRGTHYPTALVQIATHERCYLFRLTHVGMPQALADIFANPKICPTPSARWSSTCTARSTTGSSRRSGSTRPTSMNSPA